MESVLEVPSVLTTTGITPASGDQRSGGRTVVGLIERRPRLVDLDSDRALSAPDAASAPAPGLLLRDFLLTAQLLRAELEGRLLAANGNLHSWSILSALERSDGLSQKGLSEACGIDAPTITRVLDRLETQGFVRRRRDAEDRRVVRVSLTGNGRLQHLHLARAAQSLEHELGAALSPWSSDALRGALDGVSVPPERHPARGVRS